MKTKTSIKSNTIYTFKRGQVSAYSSDPKRFNCLIPADNWSETICIGDVWICDREGNIDPGVNVSPVPVSRSVIGGAIGNAQPV